jgi:hypothetical protein
LLLFLQKKKILFPFSEEKQPKRLLFPPHVKAIGLPPCNTGRAKSFCFLFDKTKAESCRARQRSEQTQM